jgi:branched-chain amino acid transport system permease protein
VIPEKTSIALPQEARESRAEERRSRVDAVLDRLFPPFVPMLLITGIALVVLAMDDAVMTQWCIYMLISVVMVVGLYIFAGNSGIMSFGHLAFVSIGAYTTAILTVPVTTKGVLMPDLPGVLSRAEFSTLPAVLIGGVVASVVAAALAVPLMRMSGLRAAMATFAVLQISFVVNDNWESMTRGTGSMLGVPTDTTIRTALIWAIIAIVVAYVYQVSSSGLRLRASREDESAAAAVGVHIGNERRLSFVISAFVTGVAGGIYAHFYGTFGPTDFYIGLTFLLFAMLVLGGMTSLLGAVLGVVVVSVIRETFLRVEEATDATGLREIVLALAMLGILVLRPRGITGGNELEWHHIKDGVWPWLRRPWGTKRGRERDAATGAEDVEPVTRQDV